MPPTGRRDVVGIGGGAAVPTITQLAIIMFFVVAWVLVVMIATGFTAEIFGHFGQGAAGFASVVALVCAAGLYYDQRQNRPKVVLQPPLAAVGPVRSPGSKAVLLHVALTVENRSSKPLNVRCAALDLLGVDDSGERNPTYYDDLAGVSLLDPPPERKRFERCVHGYEARRRDRERARLEKQEKQREDAGPHADDDIVNLPHPGIEAKTGARFSDFMMEPGEIVTKTWDQRVPCTYQAVQVIFKVPKPDDVIDYEAKTLVPIAEECRKAQGRN